MSERIINQHAVGWLYAGIQSLVNLPPTEMSFLVLLCAGFRQHKALRIIAMLYNCVDQSFRFIKQNRQSRLRVAKLWDRSLLAYCSRTVSKGGVLTKSFFTGPF